MTRPLRECVGQILRQDVYAERDNPPFDRVCMDGIAIRSADFTRGIRQFRIEATQPAGTPALTLSPGNSAIEIMTGAIMPHGADCVIPLEEYDIAGEAVLLRSNATAAALRNIQARGSDSAPGVPMLKAGTPLRSPEIAVVASAGLAAVKVSRHPNIVVISTGDELVEPGEPILEHQVRRSNVYSVVAALHEHGFERVSTDHILDKEALLQDRLTHHLAEHDVVILSGGVSKGKFDFVPKTLKLLDVEEVFYQVAQRPGAPMWFGIGPRGQAVFGLPGNPVSTLMCLIRYVVPALKHSMGICQVVSEPIGLASELRLGRKSMASFVPVTIQYDARGARFARHHTPNGSGDFLSLAATDGFIELPPRAEPFPEGFVGDLYRW